MKAIFGFWSRCRTHSPIALATLYMQEFHVLPDYCKAMVIKCIEMCYSNTPVKKDVNPPIIKYEILVLSCC